MTHEFVEELLELNNFAVFDGYAKAQSVIQKCNSAVCSISGGSDSDIVLDIMHNVDENGKVTYFWIDTGLEYTATKEHIDRNTVSPLNVLRRQSLSLPVCVNTECRSFQSMFRSR